MLCYCVVVALAIPVSQYDNANLSLELLSPLAISASGKKAQSVACSVPDRPSLCFVAVFCFQAAEQEPLLRPRQGLRGACGHGGRA